MKQCSADNGLAQLRILRVSFRETHSATRITQKDEHLLNSLVNNLSELLSIKSLSSLNCRGSPKDKYFPHVQFDEFYQAIQSAQSGQIGF